ncbi:hypothetical protein ALI144C_42535 [Actinosynnema sp. ALI-1.44]|uniref:hypothetical protein n=1 Tax=Actinosynnema sp. ALI-1.44 TaxID=1933779 RepID=UPI00097C3935|nr:hypothetical protein [Actinosynnema sp. ALI-1.44]ONI72697.1 hypothetical protein ALI144C_42535 [Actinosynnema sp. ALI-1.44]
MDLEDELQRLFKDERLDVRVASDAESNVVAGAHRLRRRRMVAMSAAGVLSAAVLAGGALVLTQSGPQSSGVATPPSDLPIDSTQPTAAGPSPETSVTTAPSPPEPVSKSTSSPVDSPGATKPTAQPPASKPGVILGPTGDGTTRLGDTQKDLESAKRVPTTAKEPAGCTSFPTRSATGTAYIGQSGKVVAIVYRSEATTPENITIGSTADSVKGAYRDFTGSTATVPGNTAAKYKFTFASGKVTSIALLANQQDCVS